MILLALCLGIRRSDIVNLKFNNINWHNDTITFIQQKTKVPVTLPFLTNVGNSLIDYILNSKVDSAYDEIFFLISNRWVHLKTLRFHIRMETLALA
jgi:integrase